jgi:hypothetical protein
LHIAIGGAAAITMLPTTEEAAPANHECVGKCGRLDKPFTVLAEFCETLRVSQGWHEPVV